jgi:transposase-like protein
MSIKNFSGLPLFAYAEDPVVCQYCGHVDIVSHDSSSHRWKCRQCGRTFVWGVNKGLHFPFTLYDIVLTSFLEGDDLIRINMEVRKVAESLHIQIVSISSEAVYSIVRRACIILGYFEPIAIRKLSCKEFRPGTMEMDFTPYPIYTLGSRIKHHDLKGKNINFHDLIEKFGRKKVSGLGVRKRIFVYTTGAIEVESRYPTPMVTDFSFDFRRSLRCIALMIKTFGYKPKLMKCDGGLYHRNAIRMSLPDVPLYTRTKAQEYNVIEFIERYWEELQDDCMSPYRFRSLETSRLAVELKRLDYIFLRPNSSLNGITPAAFIGIKIPGSIVTDQHKKWQKLLELANRVVAMEKSVDLGKLF